MIRFLKTILLLLLPGSLTVVGQGLTPAAFLGYETGSSFTYHHRILEYVDHLARRHEGRIRVIEYGKSYEGRPLRVVVLASEANMQQLEQIRQNHLIKIGMMEGKAVTAPSPAIAWLSYNVHGDEASASETAMEVIHSLLEGSLKPLLENLVVIVDPCLNPDGHERYVGWYNQMKGKKPSTSPLAKEHQQPWPGGRFNHYLFDLNRDWAWQVQKESQSRGDLYRQWMPHLHADFHEMGSGMSYYFPPAARPYHENVTSWQREFNQILGEYNRKHFDRNQWLYFTGTSFDLFYPSYGDTWPTFNGAIGITYEQGGSGSAGLAIARSELGDTLTLRTRIAHHLTASAATLEALSDKREEVIQEFEAFFKKGREKSTGPYKSYIIKSPYPGERAPALENFLTRNGIRFGRVGETLNVQATDLSTQKTAKYSFSSDDLLIPSQQPQSNLIQILFETSPALEDSLTYDITSWGIGYIHGTSVYGLASARTPVALTSSEKIENSPVPGTYAYLARWTCGSHVRFLSDLLANGIRVRTSSTGFEMEGERFPAGSLILMKTGNEAPGLDFESKVIRLANKHQVKLFAARTGMVQSGKDFGSGDIQVIKPLRIGLVSGNLVSPTAFGAVWHYMDEELEYPLTILDKDNLTDETLSAMDVLIFADGRYSSLFNDEFVGRLNSWVSKGGKLILMEGAANALAGRKEFELKKKGESRGESKRSPQVYADRVRNSISSESAGGIYEVTLDTTHPLAFGYENRPYFASVREVYEIDYLSSGWNVGYLKEDSYRAGFVGSQARKGLSNSLVFGVQELGRGKVIYMLDNPLFRGFWENGKVLFGNAVFR